MHVSIDASNLSTWIIYGSINTGVHAVTRRTYIACHVAVALQLLLGILHIAMEKSKKCFECQQPEAIGLHHFRCEVRTLAAAVSEQLGLHEVEVGGGLGEVVGGQTDLDEEEAHVQDQRGTCTATTPEGAGVAINCHSYKMMNTLSSGIYHEIWPISVIFWGLL